MENTPAANIPIKCLKIVGIDFTKKDSKGHPSKSYIMYLEIVVTSIIVSSIVNCCVLNMNILVKFLESAWSLAFSSVIFFALDKLFIKSAEFELIFPYGSVPFFDTSNGLVFTSWFTLVAIHGNIFAMVQGSVVGLMAFFSINISENFKILNTRLLGDMYLMREGSLRLLISRHVDLIAMKVLYNQTFEIAMFLQSLCGSMHLCTIAMQILISREPATIFGSIPFIINILAELAIFCYSGQIITYESSQLNLAIQQSDWYSLSISSQRALMLMLLRSQRPLVVKAVFFQPSYELFYNILKTTVSYITVMKSLDA